MKCSSTAAGGIVVLVILGIPAVMASILFAMGNVVGPTADGHFAASLSEGDTGGALFGRGLLLAYGVVGWVRRDLHRATPSHRIGLHLHSRTARFDFRRIA